jgi:hypothetical protein
MYQNLKKRNVDKKITSHLNQCWSKRRCKLKKNVAQISTNAKLLKQKQQCIHNLVTKQRKKSTRNNKRERRERKRVLKTMLLELNKFLQVYESRRKMQIESKKR